MARPTTTDADLKELREEYDDFTAQWQDVRDERKRDMVALVDIWEAEDPEGKKQRDEMKRPIITLDELNQYVNQIINDVRQNKRAVKATPETSGATDKTAEFRQSLIRQIEYKSNAQQGAYTTMFENAVQGSYGFLRIKPEWANHRSDHQDLRIAAVPNPDMVTPDPYGVMSPDGSHWKGLYLTESWSVRDFKQKWGAKAKVVDFDAAAMREAPSWAKGGRIVVGERWRVQTKPRELYAVSLAAPAVMPGQPPAAPTDKMLFADELTALQAKGTVPQSAQRVRTVDYPYVTQHITNGLEILDETKWPGTSIPFVGCYGKILYLDRGAGPQRVILSAVRLARSPEMLYCYYRTQQAEMAGMIPKVPVVGYEGQFANHEGDWQRAPHEPIAYLEVKAKTAATGEAILPLPTRIAYEAGSHLQALELCAEGARRAIQAAMGISPLPTEAQRHNQKSGIALQQIEQSGQKGSFHFVDHYDAAITRTGQILDELIPTYYDTPRDVTVRKPDDTAIQVRINDPQTEQPLNATEGLHDITLSVGPAYASEREAASAFADTIIGSPLLQLFGPQKGQEIVALAIRLKSVGPIGDQMADLLSPPKDQQQPTPEQIAQMQGQIQDLTQKLQVAAQQLQTDAAKQQAQIQIAHLDAAKAIALQRMKDATTIRAAEITAAKEHVAAAREDEAEAIALALEQGQQALEGAKDRAHDVAMAAMQQQHATESADQAHQQALAQGEQGVAGQIAVQAAQPPPETGAGA